MSPRRTAALAAAAIAGLSLTGVALADNLVNDVSTTVDGKVASIANGGSTVVGYKVNGAGSDGCDATPASPATVTISAPSGVGVTGATLSADKKLTFSECQNFQYVTFSSSVAGDHAITHAIQDNVGSYNNHANFTLRVGQPAAPSDSTAPNITLTTPPDGAQYLLNQAVLADYACNDAESAVTQCAGPVASGDAIDTGSVGAKSFRVDAASAGGSSFVEHAYSVVYDWSGFFRPVDNGGVLNVVKAGSSVPMKFSLAGDQGLGIISEAKSRVINCETSAAQDQLENTATAGQSGLSYDGAIDQYNYVWKTDKVWATSCREFSLKLNDGTVHTALFKFSK